MVVRDGPKIELPRKARSDNLAHTTILSDVHDAGARTILRTGPQPAAISSFDVSQQALAERQSSTRPSARGATAERPPPMINSKRRWKRLLADFTDLVRHRGVAERVR